MVNRRVSSIARSVCLVVVLGSVAHAAGAQATTPRQSPGQAAEGEWRAYGRDALGSRWSPLAEITR